MTSLHAARSYAAAAAIIALGAACVRGRPAKEAALTTLIARATIIDGTGAPPETTSVRVVGDRIVEVGDLALRPADRVIDGTGLMLVPGFIDSHSHADGDIFEHRDALTAVSQGITTAVVGQDGGSADTLSEFFARLERAPPALNVASYVGHNTVRAQVMGDDFRRHATANEVERMKALVRDAMRSGALGLSSGLEYDPGIYSAPSEVIELAKTAARFGGRYISHIRSEDRQFWKAIDEIIAIGREAKLPVHVSHMKLAMRRLWGRADSLIAVLNRARAASVNITADVYPYTYWQSTLTVLFPERDFRDRAAARFALEQVAPPEGLLLSRYAPEPAYVGKTVAEISEVRGTDPVTTLLDLIHRAEAFAADTAHAELPVESVIGTSMDERDIERILAWPFANVCSDGGLVDQHPRGAGAFPRVLGRYVRARRVLRWAEAVRKMTSLAAANVGIRDRGIIAPGRYADLVLLDPRTVADRATPAEPQALSAGIRVVWVNGEVVYRDGKTTRRYPGRVIRRAPSS